MARITSLGASISRYTTTAENADGITINIDVSDDADAVKATAEIADIETENSLDELEAEQVDTASTAAESAFGRIRAMQRNGTGVNPTTGAEVVAHLKLIGRLYGMRSNTDFALMPSAESSAWATPSKLPPNLHMAAEFAGEMVRKGWEWVKKKFAEWMEKVTSLWNRYGSSAARYKRSATALKQKVSSGNFGKLDNKNLSDSALAKKLDSGVDNKIDAARLVTSMMSLEKQVVAVKEAYIAAMADSNFDEAMKFLEAEKDASNQTDGVEETEDTTKVTGHDKKGRPITTEVPGTPGIPSSAMEAMAAFGKWLAAMGEHLSPFMKLYTREEMKALGRQENDVKSYVFMMSAPNFVLPGNRAFVNRTRTPHDVSTAAGATALVGDVFAAAPSDAIEMTTLRCSQYNTKNGRTESISDQIPVLTQAQMTDLALACEKAAEELVTLAETVTKGKPKRDRLKKAIDRAADMAAKAESKESKAYTMARKMATTMMQQIDNPANDFQTAALQAVGNSLSYVNQSLNAYSK